MSRDQTFNGVGFACAFDRTNRLLQGCTERSKQVVRSALTTTFTYHGDGYADVIVGACLYDNGQTDEGGAFVYYGNAGDGLDLLPRQMRADGSAPIAHWACLRRGRRPRYPARSRERSSA